ncbi:MAG: hypothetical protein ABSE08_05900 [Syntrophobacteraceae bacterium]|jgi:hypothetical protein
MADMILEPFAAHLFFAFPDPKRIEEWAEILMRFLETSAMLCRESGPCVIGHIKGLALLNGSRYVRVSVISPSLPAQVETNASGDLAEMTVTLNMLVYGLSKKCLDGIVKETATRPGTGWSGRVTVEPVAPTTTRNHPGHHHGC